MLAGHQRETECSPKGGRSAPQVSTYVHGFTAVGAKGDEPVQEVGAGRAERGGTSRARAASRLRSGRRAITNGKRQKEV